MWKRFVLRAALFGCAIGLPTSGYGQASAVQPGSPPPSGKAPLPRFGIALSAGTLGGGIQVATAVARHTNIRGGINYFKINLSGTDNKDNLTYDGHLRLSSGEVLLDQNLAGPVHISAGALVYDGFQATGNVHVAGGQSFTLNSVSYTSSPSDPVTGTGTITVRKIAPEVLLGFGNLLPRSARHFTFNVDLGAAFQGSPNTMLNLTGSTCAGATCSPISSNSAVQANVSAEQVKISNTLKPFQFYPVLRLSFGYKF